MTDDEVKMPLQNTKSANIENIWQNERDNLDEDDNIQVRTLRRHLRLQIMEIFGINEYTEENENPNVLKRARCASCNRKQDRKTNTFCISCKKNI